MSGLEYWTLPASTFVLSFIIVSHVLAVLDIYQPSWYKSREISPRPKVTWALYTRVMSKTMLNFIISFIIGAVLWSLRATKAPEFPTIPIALLQLVICYFFAEFSFWTTHFIAHHPALYKRVHALHHAYPKPIGLVAIYCSHWEMLIVNLPLSILMPIVLQMHPILNCIWSAGLMFYIVMIHCGHNLIPKSILDSNYHDQHHATSKGNYGSYILDNLFLGKGEEKKEKSEKKNQFSFFKSLNKVIMLCK